MASMKKSGVQRLGRMFASQVLAGVFLLLSSLGAQAQGNGKSKTVAMAPPPGPTVSMILSPASSPNYVAPAAVSVSIFVYDDSLSGLVDIELYKNNTLIATEYGDALNTTVTGLPAGTHTFNAIARNEAGATGYAVRSVTITAPTNQAPTVSLTANGNYVAPATINLTATASDSDGSISKVEFFNGSTLIATATTAPYMLSWSGVSAGTYSLTAKATDNAGAATTSSPVSVTVRNPISDAQFIGQTVPTTMQTGTTQAVTVQMKNTGETTWASATSFRLGSQNPHDNTIWTGANRVALPASIAPGATATFSFNITAPTTAGTYNFQWRMLQEGIGWFGAQSTNAAIQVTAPPPPSEIRGNIDGIDSSTAVTGWACSSYRNDPVAVHLYVGGAYGSGAFVGAYTANLASEAGVASACSASGTNYRFSIPLTNDIRQQHAGKAIHIHGISPVGGSNLTIANSGAFTVPALPPPPTPPVASYSRTEVITYHDNTAKWVLGQTASVTCAASVPAGTACDGDVVSSSTFDASTALPLTHSSFGKLQQTLTYNADGTVATVRDGNNNVTTLSNWKRGIPQTIKYPATPESPTGATESAVVNDNGWIASVTDENGYKTCYGYDAMGRLGSITYPSEATPGVCDTTTWAATTQIFEPVATSEYGIAAGHWRQTITTGNGQKITYFDALWRPVVVREYDAANVAGTQRFQRFTYDHDGRVTFAAYPGATDALSTGTWTDYDALGRVTSVSQDSEHGLLTTTTEYLSGFQTRTTNPRGFQTLTSYQVYDQPSYDYPVGINHPEGAYTEIYRDAFGKPTAIRRRNGDNSVSVTRSYVYDGYQQLCKSIEPETGAMVLGYDWAGNLTKSASGLQGYLDTTSCNHPEAWASGRAVDRSYDARNRLTSLTFADSRGNQTWTYTPDGLPATINTYNDANNGAAVVNAYSYNKRRLLTGESSSQPGWYTWGLGYGYSPNGHLASQSYPSEFTVTYSPNALGQPTQIVDAAGQSYVSGVSYYPNGAIKQFTYGNGIVHTMTQNARQLPLRSTDGGASILEYNYDANANVSAIWDIARGGDYNRVMTYDSLDRLTSAKAGIFGGSDWTHRFTYDALDNLKSWKLAGVKDYAEYVYDASNRLGNIRNSAGATVVGLSYDVQGNLSNKNGQGYTFDYGNRLREVEGKEQYRYDGHGRRVLARHPTQGNKLSIYSRDGEVMYEHNERSPSRKAIEHIYLAGSIVANRERNIDTDGISVKFDHTDALGSPVAVTNEAGQVIDRTNWESYGAAIGKPNYDGPGYTGHVMDGATGLTYMQQRYYDPQIGRFLSVDPITAYSNPVGAFNRYRYANNNPYRFADPDGRQSREFNWENRHIHDIKPPPVSEKDWLNKPLGYALGAVLAAPLAGFGYTFALANPGAVAAATEMAAGAAGVSGTAGALQSTGGVVRQFQQTAPQNYFRVFSGDSTTGRWLTSVAPKSSAWAQEALSLPPGNKATMIQKVLVPAGTRLERSRASPVPEWGRIRGGAEQFKLLDPIPPENFGPGVPLP